jgi:hypothetical protein
MDGRDGMSFKDFVVVCVRHGFASANYYPRHWVFEASFEGVEWDVLRTHTNDAKITAPHGSGSWGIDVSDVDSSAVSL